MKEILWWYSHFKSAQNLVAEHYERDFDMIFNVKTVQNLVAEHCERDFDMISILWWLKTLLQSTMKEDIGSTNLTLKAMKK